MSGVSVMAGGTKRVTWVAWSFSPPAQAGGHLPVFYLPMWP
jgi:hypothetical protein